MNKEGKKVIEEDFKPRTWLLIVLIIIGLGIVVVLVNKVIEDKKKKDAEIKETTNDFVNDIFSNFKEQFDNVKEAQDKHDIDSFNRKFEMHSGTQYRIFIISLIDDVITNNKKNNDHVITVINGDVNSSDPEEIRKIKDNFTDMTAQYEVILDYDENGYVSKITIE